MTRAQKKQFLAPVLAGERIGALALTEPEAGSDAASTKTRARVANDEFVLDGEKRFITNGGIADFLLVFAVTDRKEGGRGYQRLCCAEKVTQGPSGQALQASWNARRKGRASPVPKGLVCLGATS